MNMYKDVVFTGPNIVVAFKDSKPLIDIVYGRLRDLILSNELYAGQKLVDRDLAEQLNVSRTPIREALGRLTMMGLVETSQPARLLRAPVYERGDGRPL